MQVKSLDDYTPSELRAAERVLDSLDQLENRMEAHFARQRRHQRVQFRGKATVCIPVQSGKPIRFNVHARSLSQGGMSFICPEELDAERLIIGLHLADGELRWYHAAIIRKRDVLDEDFWEYGVAFQGRAEF